MTTRMEYFIFYIQKLIKGRSAAENINYYSISFNLAVFGRVLVDISFIVDLPHPQPQESTESWNIKNIFNIDFLE